MPLDAGLLRDAKALGFSDRAIEQLIGGGAGIGPGARARSLAIMPHLAQIDTLAAEFPAETNYLYSTLPRVRARRPALAAAQDHGARARAPIESARAWSSTGAPSTRSRPRRRSATRPSCSTTTPRRSAPTTTSATSSSSTRSASSRVLDLCERENVDGVIVSMGGQIPNNLALQLHQGRRQGSRHASREHRSGRGPQQIQRAAGRTRHRSAALVSRHGCSGRTRGRSSASAATRYSCARATY